MKVSRHNRLMLSITQTSITHSSFGKSIGWSADQ